MKLLVACLFLVWAHIAIGQDRQPKNGGPPPSLASAGLTQEQGEEILNELRLIRKALEDQRRVAVAPSANAVPAQGAKMTVDPGWFALGSDQAPVTMVEFSDFQCPFCRQFNTETFHRIKEMYIDTGKVRFVSREYPLEFHPDALNAALAVLCAGAQKHYWQMRDVIIEPNSDLSANGLDRDAENLALDISKFRACMKDRIFLPAIQRDISDGQSMGVTGTPSFLIGNARNEVVQGVRIDGAQPFAQFAIAIASALAANEATVHSH